MWNSLTTRQALTLAPAILVVASFTAQPAMPATATSPAVPARPASVLPAAAGCTQTATNVNPYIMASVTEQDISANFAASANKDWRISPGIGIGALGHLTNGLVVDVWAEAKFPQKGFCLGQNVGVLCGNVGTQYTVGLAFKY